MKITTVYSSPSYARLWDSSTYTEDEEELAYLFGLITQHYFRETGSRSNNFKQLANYYMTILGVSIPNHNIHSFLLRIARQIEHKMPIYITHVSDLATKIRRKCICGHNEWNNQNVCSNCGMYD
jgi:hypothetical protein